MFEELQRPHPILQAGLYLLALVAILPTLEKAIDQVAAVVDLLIRPASLKKNVPFGGVYFHHRLDQFLLLHVGVKIPQCLQGGGEKLAADFLCEQRLLSQIRCLPVIALIDQLLDLTQRVGRV